jgi:hypothetical protein
MTTYKIVVKPSVKKDIRPIPEKVIAKIFNKVVALLSNDLKPAPRADIILNCKFSSCVVLSEAKDF